MNPLEALQSSLETAVAAWHTVGKVEVSPEAILEALGGADGVVFDTIQYNYGQQLLVATRGRRRVMSDAVTATLYERTLDLIEGGDNR